MCSHTGHTHLEIKGYPYLLGNYVNVCPFPRRVLGSKLKRAIETMPQLYSEDRYGQVLEKELQEEIRHSKEGKGKARCGNTTIFSTQKYLEKDFQLCAFKANCH